MYEIFSVRKNFLFSYVYDLIQKIYFLTSCPTLYLVKLWISLPFRVVFDKVFQTINYISSFNVI